MRSRWALWLVCVVLALVLSCGGIALYARWSELADAFRERALISQTDRSHTRSLAARVDSVGYRPLRTTRGDEDSASLRLEVSSILAFSKQARLRGRALLLDGQASAAAAEFERAAGSHPDARLLSDLAAARIAEADETASVEPAIAGAIAAQQAIRQSPGLAAAHFNLALALRRLGLDDEARDAFEAAAALEPGTSWSIEALTLARELVTRVKRIDAWAASEERLKQTTNRDTQRAVVSSNIQSARRYAEGPYLVDWAAARASRRENEALHLRTHARLVAGVLRDVTGESLAWDAIAAIDRAEEKGEESALALARAHLLYRDGRIARRDHDDDRAITLLRQSADELARAGSPLQYVARYQIAGAYYEQGRIEDALAQLDSLDGRALRAKGYRALAAQLGWERGICLLVRGAYGEAFDVLDQSYQLAAATRDDDLAATLDSLAAQALEYLNEPGEAWRRRARALRRNAVAGNDFGRAVMLSTAANLQLAARNWATARLLLDYALPLAEAARDPLIIAQVHAQRSVARDELGDHDEAARDRSDALRSAQGVRALEVRDRLLGFVDMADGIALRDRSPASAVRHFERVIERQKRSGQSSLLPRLYYECSRARGAAGDREGERKDLRAGIDVVAAWEMSITTPEQRVAITVWGDVMRRDLISLELAGGDFAAAFAYADDRPNAILFSEGVHNSPIRKQEVLRFVQRELAPEAAVIEFVRAQGKFLVFVIRRDYARAVVLPNSVAEITTATTALRNAESARIPDTSADLYKMILRPIQRDLSGLRTIAIGPDHELSGLSFGALRNPENDRYLGQDFIVVHAQTATAAIGASKQARDRTNDALLAIGASEFDRSRYSDLPALSNVKREAEQVSAGEVESRLLVGSDVTARNLAQELPKAGLVHYAGHIVGRGADSRLLVSGGSLTAREIGRMRFDKTRTVVLAACRGAGTSDAHPVFADIASAFLMAGVPVVIASANEVDDAETPQVMLQLHAFLRLEYDAAAALRATINFERSNGKQVPLSVRFLAVGGASSLVR